jgi:hypothetical protein
MKNKKGQIAVFIALSFSFLFLLLAMVINISFLVTAKINLQNSVDLAAYAGAAQQARYMTKIGRYNYEMRRNYKAMSYDYMIGLNAEYKPEFFKKYVNNEDPPTPNATSEDIKPIACASIQRRKDNSGDVSSFVRTTCQVVNPLNLQKIVDSAQDALDANLDAGAAACATDPGGAACLAVLDAAASAYDTHAESVNLDEFTADMYENYNGDFDNNKHYQNYNRRLLMWMLHDYRHLQTRIRGIHYGSIKIKDRWLLAKTPGDIPTVFKNSPISVAAKVINGYTTIDTPMDQSDVIEIKKPDVIKNPAHNAAYASFIKNLIAVNQREAKLYFLKPNFQALSSSENKSMAKGCSGKCEEYKGPFLKLHQHDVDFTVNYISMYEEDDSGWKSTPKTEAVNNFPVGVAKDARYKVYYPLIAVTNVSSIPFNVFFGDEKTSTSVPLVAVAAARPFGSRIGPFINEKCDNLYKGNWSACKKNGLDPLYPFSEKNQTPNFSIKKEDAKLLGVKYAVSKTEASSRSLNTSNASNDTSKFTKLYASTTEKFSRWRHYVDPDNKTKDDGFQDKDEALNETGFYDNNNRPMHPVGNRNSIVAWTSNPKPTYPSNLKDNYEGYLTKNVGSAIYTPDTASYLEDREADNNEEYKLYLFKYPKPKNNNSWMLSDFVSRTDMEESFASVMAVNEFEIGKYIIPYNFKADPDNLGKDVLNWEIQDNKIFKGAEIRPNNKNGEGNKEITSIIPNEVPSGYLEGISVFSEGYGAHRTGFAGYRVKLVNIKSLRENFKNPLKKEYTIPYQSAPGGSVKVNLDKIYY